MWKATAAAAADVVFARRLSGISPFHENTPRDTILKVKAAEWDFDKTAFANISDEAKDFISKLLVKEPRCATVLGTASLTEPFDKI